MKKTTLTLLALGIFSICSAQYRSGGGASDKLYFGGGFGLSAGTGVTSISGSPMVGYKITNDFSAGIRLTYQYNNYKELNVSYSNLGGSLFSRYKVLDRYFAHLEYERLKYEIPVVNSMGEISSIEDSYNAFFIGGGYTERISRSSAFSVTVLYDLLYDEIESPYPSPFAFRAGIVVGF